MNNECPAENISSLERLLLQQSNLAAEPKWESCLHCLSFLSDCQDEEKTDRSQIRSFLLPLEWEESNIRNLRSQTSSDEKQEQVIQYKVNVNNIDKPEGSSTELIRLLTKRNQIYAKACKMFKYKLQNILILIQDQLISSLKNFHYFTDFCNHCELKETSNMIEFIQKTIYNIIENTSQYNKLEESIIQLKIENNGLHKANQKLKNYIEERKVYSQKLKLKIKEHKDQLTQTIDRYEASQKHVLTLKEEIGTYQKYLSTIKIQLQQSREQNDFNSKIFSELATLEENLDLKYRNRNQLILMIRSLSVKLFRHERQCHQGQNKVLNQDPHAFLQRAATTKKKSHSTDPN